MHQMGSHGPGLASGDSASRLQKFLLSNADSALQSCTHGADPCAHDNGIVYADHLLASIQWLRAQTALIATAMLCIG
jgi:glucan phosphoethanolaminetransferase (alkaline phosphatase superfamily)